MSVALTVVGSVNLDHVAYAPRLPEPGETISGARFERHPGGKGANQALAARRLGAEVRLVCGVGRDPLAGEALALLEAAGVSIDAARVEQPTGVALIVVAEGGENQIVVAAGANLHVPPTEVGGAVLCQLEVNEEATIAAAASAGRFFLNAAPVRPMPEGVLRRAEVIVVNEHEHRALPEFARAQTVVLTLGAEGAVWLEGGEEVARARPPEVNAVDSTGAGDSFTASLVVSLLEGRTREEALRRGCAAGALAASRAGAQPSLPTRDEVEAILRA